jgi:hypothetical protein
MFDKLPIEILYEIGSYLDYKDITGLRLTNRNFYFIFGYIAKSHLLAYLQQFNISINAFNDLSNISLCILLNVLFFVKKHIISNSLKMLTINITNTFFKKYYFKSNLCNVNILEKCNFLLSYELFKNIQFDCLESIFSNLVIDKKTFLKNDGALNINNMGNSKVIFTRTDYDIINERDTYLGKKYMVTFHFFI